MALQTVHVLATTPDGTRAALATGQWFARRRHTNVVLLVTAPGEWETARCVRIAHEFDRFMRILICRGANTTEAIKQVVPALALVVLGGPARRWWPTAEQRMADRLRRHGRDVVFVPEKASSKAQRGGGATVDLAVRRIEARRAPRIG
jgi:hypothetical protein